MNKDLKEFLKSQQIFCYIKNKSLKIYINKGSYYKTIKNNGVFYVLELSEEYAKCKVFSKKEIKVFDIPFIWLLENTEKIELKNLDNCPLCNENNCKFCNEVLKDKFKIIK